MASDLKLIVNDYQASKKNFENEKNRLLEEFSNYNLEVEHIGSTAVPGTIGKGIIDILVMCDKEGDQIAIREKLIKTGYIEGELNKVPDGRLFFSNSQGYSQSGGIHLHLVLKNDTKNLVSLKFRDYLSKHPEEIEAYNEEKIRLAEETNYNRHDYATLKEKFIKKIMEKILTN